MKRQQYPSTKDVDALKKLVAEKRKEGDKILEKVQQFQKSSKTRQKSTQKASFRFEWLHESRRLADLRKTLEQDIERTLWRCAADEPNTEREVENKMKDDMNNEETESDSGLTGRRESNISFSDLAKEHADLAISRQGMMNEVMGEIGHVQMLVQQIKASSSNQNSLSDTRNQVQNFKHSLIAQISELEKEQATLEQDINELQSYLSKQQNINGFNSQASTPRTNLFDTLSESPSFSSSTSSSNSSPSSSTFSTPSSTPRQLVHSISNQSKDSILSSSSSSSSSSSPSRPSSAHSSYSVPFSDLSSTFSDSSQLTNSSLIFQIDQLDCRDIHLVENLRDEWNRMELRFRTHLTSLREKFMAENAVSDTRTGSWDPKSHFHFMTLYKQYLHKGKRADFIERTSIEMPTISKQEIEYHLQFVRNQHIYRIHHKAIKGMWRRERTVWFENSKALIQEANSLEEQRIKKGLQANELQQKKDHLHKKLAVWREDKAQKFAKETEKLQREEREAKEKERLLNERLAQARGTRKRLVNEYKQTKKEIEDYQREQEEEKQRELDIIKKEQDKVNAERVIYRTEESESKRQSKIQKQLEEQKILEMKELQLEKLREKVRVTAESDTHRTQQGTVSSSAPARHLPPLFQTDHGYSDHTIINQPRFKIEQALSKAGLLHTSYAREVLASVPTKVRIDQLSSDQRDLYISKNIVQ